MDYGKGKHEPHGWFEEIEDGFVDPVIFQVTADVNGEADGDLYIRGAKVTDVLASAVYDRVMAAYEAQRETRRQDDRDEARIDAYVERHGSMAAGVVL